MTEQNNKTEQPIIDNIEINDIIWEAFLENKVLILTIIPLFVGYYLQDTLFTRKLAEITVNIPQFVETMNFNKIALLLTPYIISIILFYLSNITMSKTTARIELLTMQNLVAKIIESAKTTKAQIDVNDIILHIKKIGDAKNIFYIIINYILPTIIVAISLIYNFSYGDVKYSILVILILITMICVTTKLEIDSIGYANTTEYSINELYDTIHEIMTNMDSILTSNTKEYEIKNVNNAKMKTYKLASGSGLNNNNTTYGLQIISIFSMLSINYLSYKLYSSGKIDSTLFTGTILLSLLYMDYYNNCIHTVSELINSMGRYTEMKNFFRKFKIMRYPQNIIDRQQNLTITNGDIELKNISIQYANKQIFKSFNLTIQGTKVIGLMGLIGSGKSTLLKMLAGIANYTGDIIIDGYNLLNCTYESIVENIAYIPQHPKLFNKTILYNINYGSCYTEEQINKKIDEYGIKMFIDSFPNKLHTNVGSEGSAVSGGQKQFIALIRALIQNKPIILLDEPTSSLDVTYKNVFIQLIKTIKQNKNKTVIISTHDKTILSIFDVIHDISKIKANAQFSLKNT